MSKHHMLEALEQHQKVAEDLIAAVDFSVEGTAGKSLGEQLTMYNALRMILETAERVVTTLNRNMPIVAERAATLMMTEDVDSVKSDGYTFTVKPKHYVSVNKSDTPVLHEWLNKDEEGKTMLKLSVHPATLSKFVIERFVDNGETPPPFIKVFSKQELSVRKARS